MDEITRFAVSVLSSLAASGALTTVIIWLAKNTISERIKGAIKSEYDLKLETLKDQLKANSDREIERLRADLQLAATEHQVRFSGLHVKRADIIAKSYELLVIAFNHGTEFASPIQPAGVDRESQRMAAATSIHEFYRYFDRNRIYLPATLCSRIVPLIDSLRTRVAELGSYGSVDLVLLPSDQRTQIMDTWSQTWKFFTEEFPRSRELLENEFRSLLGDKSQTGPD